MDSINDGSFQIFTFLLLNAIETLYDISLSVLVSKVTDSFEFIQIQN